MTNYSSLYPIQNNFGCYHTIDRNFIDYSVHIHDGFEIYYFISGDVTYFIEGTAYKLNPNDLLLINDRELHRPQLHSSCIYERIVLNFTKEFLKEIDFQDYKLFRCLEDRASGTNNLIPSYEVLSNNINLLIQNIINCNDKGLSNRVLQKTYTAQLLITMNNIMDNNKNESALLNRGNERVSQIIHYINDNLSSELSLEVLEDKFYVTKYYLCHQFKDITGFTINEYITYKRIMKARELIKMGYPMNEIYKLVGFSDYSNFYKAFKKANGFSPSQYKSAALK